MKLLLDDRYAPITSSAGFLEAPLEHVAAVLARWHRTLHYTLINGPLPTSLDPVVLALAPDVPDPEGYLTVTHLNERFPEVLHRLEPLQAPGRGRELLVSTRSAWTAYFENSIGGTDAFGPISFLSQGLKCRGLIVTCVPHTLKRKESASAGRYGAVQFELYGPERTEWLNLVRGVSAMNDGGPWRFDAIGTVQPFERSEQYTARRVRDRFTPEMLEGYCQAVGVDYFAPEFYGAESVLMEPHPAWKPTRIESLAQVQRQIGLTSEPTVGQ